MFILILAVCLFIFAWSRHRKAVQARKRYDAFLDNPLVQNRNIVNSSYSSVSPSVTTPKTNLATDVALGVGAALAGAAVYEAIRHEESNDSSDSNDYNPGSFNNSSDDYDSSTGFDGGDSDGGGSSGDW